MPGLDPAAVLALTFDCYGTLVDWDGGIAAAVRTTPGLEGCDVARLLREREAEEACLEAGPFRPYRDVLAESLVRAAAGQGRPLTREAAVRFAGTMSGWPPFADSAAALARLASRYRLAILSNVDTAVLAASVRGLGVAFDALVTAEEVRSYKPARAHFDEGLLRLGLPKERVLHVAGSLYHDVAPAGALGWRTAWVDRRGEGDPGDARPDLVVPDLATLAERLLA